jgi:hypothetical protein
MSVQTRWCPTCCEAFAANPVGRPKLFCSAACRREMHGIREELPRLERELAEARTLLATDFGGRAHYWKGHIAHLEGAIAEAHMRLGQLSSSRSPVGGIGPPQEHPHSLTLP